MKKTQLIIATIIILLALLILGGVWSCTRTGKSSDLKQYNGKQFDVFGSDGKIKGIVELQEKDGQLRGLYHFRLDDSLKNNGTCEFSNKKCSKDEYHYEYAATMEGNVNTDTEKHISTITSVFCNADFLPTEELAGPQSDQYYYSTCHDGTISTPKSEKFYIYLAPLYDSYDDFLATNTFTLYDASDYWEADTEAGSYTLNQRAAVEEKNKYKSFTFEIKE